MLAISTATKQALIAIEANGKKMFKTIEADHKQSENLMKEIHKMLSSLGAKLGDVKNFAIVVGPGSFTGLRIGAALVKGFCAGLKTSEVALISTLDFMAQEVVKQVMPRKNFSCYMNAQSDNFYAATFDKKGCKTVDDHLCKSEDVLRGKESKFCLSEEAFLPYGINLTPQTLLEMALDLEKKNALVKAKDISVKYIRRSQAEEKV